MSTAVLAEAPVIRGVRKGAVPSFVSVGAFSALTVLNIISGNAA